MKKKAVISNNNDNTNYQPETPNIPNKSDEFIIQTHL